MPSEQVILRAKGLYTNPNLISEVPEGALVVADDVVIDREGIIEPRRGFTRLSGAVASQIDRLVPYQDQLLIHNGDTTLQYRNGSSWTALSGTYAAPNSTSSKMQFAEAGKNLYLTTSGGVYRLDAYNGTPTLSGVMKPPGLERNPMVAIAAVAGLVRVGTTVTATTNNPHSFYIGQVVNMNSAGEANFAAGNKTVVTVPSATSFTYTEAGAAVASGAQQTFIPAEIVSGDILTVDKQFAYRVTFTFIDANGNEMESAPSSRRIVANASGTPGYVALTSGAPVLRVMLPSGVTTSYRVNLYRSIQTATTIEPSDELGMVFSRIVTEPEVSQKWMDITDITPDTRRGATLYTSPSQDGITLANERPPYAKDLALFGGSLWFANTVGLQRFEMTILGVGGTTGIQSGDQISFSGSAPGTIQAVYQFTSTTPTYGEDNYIKLETSGSPSQNIRNTALNLCAAVNRQPISTVESTFWAYYVSTTDDDPGKVVFEARSPGTAVQYPKFRPMTTYNSAIAFAPQLNAMQYFEVQRVATTVTCTVTTPGSCQPFTVGQKVALTNGTADFPAGVKTVVSVTSTTFTYTEAGAATSDSSRLFVAYPYVTSSAETKPNRLYYSRVNQPDAVPAFNYIDVGSGDAEILRIVPTRSSLFVFKEDGLFRVVGNNEAFDSQAFDPTVVITARDSAAAVSNKVFALTNQGVVAVSDTGVDIVSNPIKRTIDALRGVALSNLKNLTYGAAYESDHKYLLGLVSSNSDTWPTQVFVYNVNEDNWVRWPLQRRCAVVNPADDKLYFASAQGYYVHQERKSFTYTDYTDTSGTATLVSKVGNVFTLGTTVGIEAGDMLTQGPFAVLVDVVNNSTDLTVNEAGDAVDFVAGSIDTLKALHSSIQWAPITGGQPGKLKTWQDSEFMFANAFIPRFSYNISTELVPTATSITVTASSISAGTQWSSASGAWDNVERAANVRVFVPQEHRMSDRLNVGVSISAANSVWAINGVSQLFNSGSPRAAK